MKYNPKRRTALITGVAVTALALAACSGADPESPTASPDGEQPAAVEELEIWLFSSSMPPVIEEKFGAAYPDYDLNIVEIPIGDMSQRLVVALQGGEGMPDVVQLPLRESGGLMATGQFLDMSAELGPIEGDFPEGSLIRAGEEIYTFTVGQGNMGLWVNEAALAEHDLAVPEDPTWDDIVEVARDLKEASDGTQFMFMQPPGANGANMFNAFFNSRGGTWWDAEGNFAADTALATETLQWMVDLDKEGLVYHGVWTEPTYWDAIRTNEIVGWTMNFGVGNTNLQKNVPEQSGDWRLVTWPKWSDDAEQYTGVFGGALFAGLENADNVQGAKDFLMWWLTPEGLQAQADTLGLVAYKPAAEMIDLGAGDPYFGGQSVRTELASVPYPEFNFFHWPETEGAVTAAVDQAYSGALTPAEAIEAIVAELEGL